MKTNVIFGGALMLLFTLFSCSDETTGDSSPTVPKEEIPQEVSLVIKTNNKEAGSRAEYPSEGDEALIANNRKVKLYVYKATGELEKFDEDLQLDGQSKATIMLTTGEKYFYVFANTTGSSNTDAAAITKKDFYTPYELQTVDIAFGTDNATPDLTEPNFILGTLWREKVEITSGMTAPVVLNIGRMVAKVKLTGVDKGGTYSVMAGTFTEAEYRIASVPTKNYWVGQYDHQNWTLPPPPGDNNIYGAVTSAVHNEPPVIDPGDTPNPLYHHYPEYIDVTEMPVPDTGDMTEFFYTIENTTAKDNQSLLYYGNTTHIRLKTVYTPVATEVYDAMLKNNNQTLTGGTFWTIVHNGIRYITNARPDDSYKDEDTEIKEYKNGVNYHKFAIKDVKQTDVEKRHSVYRNHFYQISVTGIRDLGEPTDVIDPKEPIPIEEEVEIAVEVIDWSRITQDEEI